MSPVYSEISGSDKKPCIGGKEYTVFACRIVFKGRVVNMMLLLAFNNGT